MEFEDQITYVVLHGRFSYEQVLALDVVSFGQLTESILRVRNAEKVEAAWTAMIASQGQHKSMKDWVKKWEDTNPMLPKGNDAAAFIARFGGGI